VSRGDFDARMGAMPYPLQVTIMKFYDNAIMTDKAFILFSRIQHVSWDIEPDNMVMLKIYSSGGKILQLVNHTEFYEFLKRMKAIGGVDE
jgi:hypothetical protein